MIATCWERVIRRSILSLGNLERERLGELISFRFPSFSRADFISSSSSVLPPSFREVHKSTTESGQVVALKRILVHSENDGVSL